MCGRKTLTKGKQEIIEELLVEFWEEDFDFQPSYNVAPSQRHPVLLSGDKGRQVRGMHWGLIPDGPVGERSAQKLINARLETVEDKPAFRDLVSDRRCIVIADGYYEWKNVGRRKQPYYLYRKDRAILPMAGLFTSREVPGGHTLWTYTILTRNADGPAADIHHRMPVILPEDLTRAWLDTANHDYPELKDRLSDSFHDLDYHGVSPRVNSTDINIPLLIAPWVQPENLEIFPTFQA